MTHGHNDALERSTLGYSSLSSQGQGKIVLFFLGLPKPHLGMYITLDKLVELHKSRNLTCQIVFVLYILRAFARSGGAPGGGLVVLGGDNVPSLVEIGLTDLPKTEGA